MMTRPQNITVACQLLEVKYIAKLEAVTTKSKTSDQSLVHL